MEKSQKPKSIQELKQFGYTMAAICFYLVLFSLWKHDFSLSTFPCITTPIGIIFTFLALFVPSSLDKVEHYWMLFGEKLNAIMTQIILALSFFLLITPIGLLMKLFRKDLLQLKIDRSSKSYWNKVEKDGPASRPYAPY